MSSDSDNMSSSDSGSESGSWTDNPWRYKDMKREELSMADRERVDVLMRFSDKMPIKGLVRVGKKNFNLFKALRKEQAEKAKNVGNTNVPNLQELLVEVHVHGGSKRKAVVPVKQGLGKDLKRVRATMLGSGSTSGA
ncbi:hypothetical protein DEO72_LG6g2013 [Vigna unguiculata]|uniref:Uncharacterized protein n=1 Tax=Vigna unguiculata TaxID=3917 RepID=A0A4D6M908_VIGUN|nr:hypothetical protein DEO72_LG6g2013 [Vigna unguiculata]